MDEDHRIIKEKLLNEACKKQRKIRKNSLDYNTDLAFCHICGEPFLRLNRNPARSYQNLVAKRKDSTLCKNPECQKAITRIRQRRRSQIKSKQKYLSFRIKKRKTKHL